jgi:arylsulfatase A-like enzyme
VTEAKKGKADKRNRVFLTLLLVVLAGVLAGQWRHEPRQSRLGWLENISDRQLASRPDILLVVYDARRADDFSFGPRGNHRGDTKFLAEFQKEALVFGNAVAPGTWTIPVHASIFTGLSSCDLGIDHYNPGFASLSPDVLTLAEILNLSGYQTLASADHPFFFNAKYDLSLVRGFAKIDVVTNFSNYELVSNMGTRDGTTTRRRPLAGLPDMSREELESRIAAFNRDEGDYEARGWDQDEKTGARLADLQPLFDASPYFERRYGSTLESALPARDHRAPYFLFVNLHMATIALPDPYLFSRWSLETLMGNARIRGVRLSPGPRQAAPRDVIRLNYARLGLSPGVFEDGAAYLKHIFDNRFYDATFRGLWRLLERRGLTRRTLTVVTSDHGLSLSERGERRNVHEGARPNEYLSRVPLVVRFPQGSNGPVFHGSRDEAVSLIDLFPTLVESAVGRGVFKRWLPIRGRSLVTRIANNAFERVLVSESSLIPAGYRRDSNLIGYAKAVYSGNDKLIYVSEPLRVRGFWPNLRRLDSGPEAKRASAAEPWERLFDLASDPLEQHDLSKSRPERVREIAGRLGGYWRCRPIVSAAAAQAWSRESLETIRALGYVH